MLYIEGQCLGIAAFSDQMSCIQSHILVQNLVVLFGVVVREAQTRLRPVRTGSDERAGIC